ncbi:hypothetical protein A3J78_01025 [Candidatus Beckwithbacteria bacterium RBG_13_35_6]|uniref:Toxin YoeB n=1 Tax=Candidatus Beckwithbacteria bacterium RBG_13_35_6 TaxID=1797456 RepID=A0A1F5DD82_9BACT|nr:MAG: hypothetical protein A3J78_01025 [Candidatus Beckwithbacteria bacterium RBG_13_35_6]
MVDVLPLNQKLIKKAQKLGVKRKLDKAIGFLSQNHRHPSLRVELLEPNQMGIWSFRLDKKIRALFIWRKDKKAIEILNITKHYHK